MGKKRRAYTLFELIAVCVLLALLAAMVSPSLDSMYGDTRITAGADMVKARLAEARTRAVEEGRPYRFEILDATKCRVVPDSSDAGASADANADNEDILPRNVSFGGANSADAGGAGGLRIVFLPDGTARDDAEIPLTSTAARPLTLKLRAFTATVTAVRPAEGSQP